MLRRRLSTFALAAATVVAVGALLSGCSLIPLAGYVIGHTPHPTVTPQSASAKPTAGECWRATYNGVIQYADWNDTNPVDCSQKHQLYTLAVLELKSKHTGPEFDSEGELQESIINDAFSTCQHYQDTQIGELDPTDGRFQLKVYVPHDAQWKTGARWVRCDINIFAIGSKVSDPTLESLPSFAALTNDIQNKPDIFDDCVNVPDGDLADGPKADSAVYANCDDSPEWVLRGYFSSLPLIDTSYPTPAAFASVYKTQCKSRYADATHVTFASYPTKSDWNSGQKDAECWVGVKR